MDKSCVITLERPRYKTDALDQHVPDGVETQDVYCSVKSVTRTEWATAAQNGLKAVYCVTIWADEYQGELIAILDGVRYGIYRTYQPNGEDTELYLERKVGVNGS